MAVVAVVAVVAFAARWYRRFALDSIHILPMLVEDFLSCFAVPSFPPVEIWIQQPSHDVCSMQIREVGFRERVCVPPLLPVLLLHQISREGGRPLDWALRRAHF